MTDESAEVEEFVRTLSRVHSGARGALVELARLLPKVRLVRGGPKSAGAVVSQSRFQ